MRLDGKVAIVTGSSRGIGRAIAECFLTSGASVVLNGRSAETLNGTHASLSETGPADRLMSLRADVSLEPDVKRLFDETIARFGRLDILVNNAGVFRNSLVARMDEAEWNWVMENNLKSAFLCTRHAARLMMRQRSGRILFLSSVVALGGNPFQANYAASKAGIDGLMMATAKELAPFGITVNSVAPGYILTDMTRDFPEAVVNDILKFIPLGRAGTAEEVAHVAAFLAGPEASYVTGQIIQVDGGRVIR